MTEMGEGYLPSPSRAESGPRFEYAPDRPETPGAARRERAAQAQSAGQSSTIGAQLWLAQSPWQTSAAWAVAAALLAYGLAARSFYVDWRLIALALLLADPLWGGIWRLAAGRRALLPLPPRPAGSGLWLPYLRPDSPAARILGKGGYDAERGREVLPLAFRVALPTLGLSLAIGWVLGAHALWLTAAVMAVSACAWVSRQFLPDAPAVLQSLVTVALPWILALNVLGLDRSHELFGLHTALFVVWTVHHWAQLRMMRRAGPAPLADEGSGVQERTYDRFGLGLFLAADVSLGALLIAAQVPLWLALIAVMWLPTYLTLYQGKGGSRPAFWWLAAMLVSAAAVGSRM